MILELASYEEKLLEFCRIVAPHFFIKNSSYWLNNLGLYDIVSGWKGMYKDCPVEQ